MILLTNAKSFLDNKKDFYRFKDLVIINGSQSSKLQTLSGTSEFQSCLKPKKSLLEADSDSYEADELVHRFVKNPKLTTQFAIITAAALESGDDVNIVIILANNVYKRGFIKKALCNQYSKMLKIDDNIIVDVGSEKAIAKAYANVNKAKIKKLKKKISNIDDNDEISYRDKEDVISSLEEKIDELRGDNMKYKKMLRAILEEGKQKLPVKEMKKFMSKYSKSAFKNAGGTWNS